MDTLFWLKLALLGSILITEETFAQDPAIPQEALILIRQIKMIQARLRGFYLTPNVLSGILDGDEVITNIPALQLARNYLTAELQGRKKRSTADGEEILDREKRGIMDFSNQYLATGKWPNARIAYALNQTMTAEQKSVITQALRWWTDKTCIRFTEVFQANFPTEPHVLFTPGASCVSFVGRTIENIPQPTYLDANCFQLVGRVVHEIGHSIGLWHTHQLSTKNDYIVIYPNSMNMQNDGEILELPASLINYYNLPYDFASIMHYNPRIFAMPGLTTIETRDPLFQQTIGQRAEISFQDAKLVNLEYCASQCQNIRINCQNGGYQDYGNCGRCICPDGWTGPLCTNVDTRRCGGDILVDGQGGSISTPGFDRGRLYQDNILCAWRLRNTLFQNIVFEFDDRFGIYCFGETAFHWVELRINGTLYDTGYRFCGTQRPRSVFVSVNPSREVMVVFKSPYNAPQNFRRTGFKLSYRLENQVGCMNGGCQNGGTCNQADGMCQCATGYKGIGCEVDDRCNRNYCQNGGTCTTRPNGAPLCSCRPGFSGPRCQTVDPGNPSPAPPQGDCGACGLSAGKTQVACNSTTETEEYEVRCESLDSGRFRLFGLGGRRQRWCTVELQKKYCCANAELMRVNDEFLCGVPGWSDWSPCAGETCGGCGIRRRSQYEIVKRFSYRTCYNDRLVICGEDRAGCNFSPCPIDQCNDGNTQVRDDSSSEEDGHSGWLWGRRRRRKRGFWGLFGDGGGGGGHHGGRQGNSCQNQCCLPYRLSSDGSTCSDGSDNPPVDPAIGNPITPSTTTTSSFLEPLILGTQQNNRENGWNGGGRTPTTIPPGWFTRSRTSRMRQATTLPYRLRNP